MLFNPTDKRSNKPMCVSVCLLKSLQKQQNEKEEVEKGKGKRKTVAPMIHCANFGFCYFFFTLNSRTLRHAGGCYSEW